MKTTKSRKAVAKKVTTTNKKTSTQRSVETGIKIINTALKKKISLITASRMHNLGKNYVYDIKANIAKNYKKNNLDAKTYNTFNSLMKEYSA